jgi:hypothetical protein
MRIQTHTGGAPTKADARPKEDAVNTHRKDDKEEDSYREQDDYEIVDAG